MCLLVSTLFRVHAENSNGRHSVDDPLSAEQGNYSDKMLMQI